VTKNILSQFGYRGRRVTGAKERPKPLFVIEVERGNPVRFRKVSLP
jgi:hypothetical protein